MPANRNWWRRAAALLVIAHGWAHAVLPLRGFLDPEALATNLMPAILYATPLLGFTAAGLGLLGVRPLTRAVRPLLVVAAGYSLVGLAVLGQESLWWGGFIDVGLLMAGATGVLGRSLAAPPEPNRARRVLRDAVAWSFLAYTASAAMWPAYRTWGTATVEHRLTLPGDAPRREPAFEIQHAVSIAAAPEDVWPWLVQLGQDRAGFYSYDWLERAFGVDVHNVAEIRPEWQQRQIGDLVRACQPDYLWGLLGPNLGWTVTDVAPERALVLQHWGTFALEPGADGTTRFIIRTRVGSPQTPVWAAALDMMTFQLPHFIMERRMMLRIKTLAEAMPS